MTQLNNNAYHFVKGRESMHVSVIKVRYHMKAGSVVSMRLKVHIKCSHVSSLAHNICPHLTRV